MTQSRQYQSIGVIGGGAFGTALGCAAVRAGRSVTLWARDRDIVAAINQDHENPHYLPGIALPDRLQATGDIMVAAACDALILAVPAQFLRQVVAQLPAQRSAVTPLIICAKGIENSTLNLMNDVVAQILPDAPLAALSGPSFAAEVARGLPTAVTLAADDAQIGAALVRALGTAEFRPYLSDDMIGVEVCGAMKNVIAIACGIAEGRGYGDSARAALMTRGLAEITRLAIAMGGQPQTMLGLAGVGDLALTCNSRQSRNFTLGYQLGQGDRLDDIFAGSRSVFEGAHTVHAAAQLAAREQVEMPICAAVSAILEGQEGVADAIAELLSRPFVREEE